MRLLIAVVALLMVGCSSGGYVDMQPVNPKGWSEPVSIFYENGDMESLRDISVALRYNSSFQDDTLSVVLHTSLPDARQFRERITLQLKREYSSAAVTSSESVPYREDCQLSQSGIYIFTITPSRAVTGVEAVGIGIR